MPNFEKRKTVELLKNAPKTLNCDYLKQLYLSFCKETVLEINDEVESVAHSLFIFIMDDATSSLDRCLAIAILQRLQPISGLLELLSGATVSQIINVIPVLFIQDFCADEIDSIVKQLCWSLEHENLSAEEEKSILTFLSRVSHSPNNQEDIRRITKLFPMWIRSNIIPSNVKLSRFHKSASSASITEVDGTVSKDIFTVLNYSQVTSAEQFLNIQAFSMLRSWLLSVSRTTEKSGEVPCPRLADLVTEDLSSAVQEYCLRLVDQTQKEVQSVDVVEYQKACLVEAIALLDVICRSDSGTVHVVLPTMKRIYKDVSMTILAQPEAKSIAVLVAVLQFFINHSSAVMYKHDSLYPFVFCDLLSICYQDNFAAFEIISLMKDNVAQLCYSSSVLEKYFPTFLQVLAWWPTTFVDDFLQLLPAFMSQNTSIELFHNLVDLPCLSAVLITRNYKISLVDEMSSLDNSILYILKSDEYRVLSKYMLRKCAAFGSSMEIESYVSSLQPWHELLLPLTSQARVLACSEACLQMMKCYFSTFIQYAEESIAIMLFPAILNRLTVLYPVPNYVEQMQKIFAESVSQLCEKHPVVIFYCQKIIAGYLNHLKNYYIAKEYFTNLVWAVGEYLSVTYSDLCRSDVIAFFFQQLEPTVYEIINSVSITSDDLLLKLLNVSASTLAKLATRSQDLLPRALLCLSKAHQQLSSFDNCYKKGWMIVTERILELLTILKTPNVASVILSPPKNLESGKLHQDATSLPFVLRAVTALLEVEEKRTVDDES